jgi:hypothetical protein
MLASLLSNSIFSMIPAVLITGKTYPVRREIKALGGKWSPDNEGWVLPESQHEAAKALVERHGLDIDTTEVDPIELERPTGERLRAIRQAKLDRRAEKRLARADRLEKQAVEVMKPVQPYMNMEFMTEPIKVGHHSERRHRKLRERIHNKIDQKFSLLTEAASLRQLAEPQKARIAGDAERRRELERAALDKLLNVGSRVTDFCFGPGVIVRVHKKSYTVKYDRGMQYARDKTYFRPE